MNSSTVHGHFSGKSNNSVSLISFSILSIFMSLISFTCKMLYFDRTDFTHFKCYSGGNNKLRKNSQRSISSLAFRSNKIVITLPLFIEVPVPSQESKQSCICMFGASILPLFLQFFY